MVRLVMVVGAEVTNISKLKKTLAIVFQRVNFFNKVLSYSLGEFLDSCLLTPGPLCLHQSLTHKNPCMHNPSLQSLCARLASCICRPDVLSYLLNHGQKLGVLAALGWTIAGAATP